jgi:hypothetical protein
VSESAPPQPAVLAEITHQNAYCDLISAFRARSAALGIATTGADVAQVAGIAPYYFAKILSPSPTPRRRWGALSLGPIMACLGIKLILQEDPEALERFSSRIPKRNESCAHPMLTAKSGRGGHTLTPLRLLRRIAPLGAAARNAALSPAQRSQLARVAAQARWRKVREAGAAKAAKAK